MESQKGFSVEQLLRYTQDQVLIFLKAFRSRTLIKLYYDNEQPDFSKLKSVWSTMSLAPLPLCGVLTGVEVLINSLALLFSLSERGGLWRCLIWVLVPHRDHLPLVLQGLHIVQGPCLGLR